MGLGFFYGPKGQRFKSRINIKTSGNLSDTKGICLIHMLNFYLSQWIGCKNTGYQFSCLGLNSQTPQVQSGNIFVSSLPRV